ncbi:MAG TPA: hypothetical protein VD997_13205 [Phycisphaerales bacterium]|nr:hypothetical protein [Phycisphaerales bacterium]
MDTAPTNLWIGRNYENTRGRVLILGESWLARPTPTPTPLRHAIERWCLGLSDSLFLSRVYEAGTGFATARTPAPGRRAWWDQVALANFGPPAHTIDPADSLTSFNGRYAPSHRQYLASVPALEQLLARLRPARVWLLSFGQNNYSIPAITAAGAIYEFTKHPSTTKPTSAPAARASWLKLLDRDPNAERQPPVIRSKVLGPCTRSTMTMAAA